MSDKYSKLYINGIWRDGSSETIYDNVNPYNNEVIASIKLANQNDIDEAYESAKQAQKNWAKTPAEEKKKVFHRAVELMQERKDELVKAMVKEAGCSVIKASTEVMVSIRIIDDAVKFIDRMDSPQVFPSQVPGKENRVYRHPAGVVGLIAPFNFPLVSAIRCLAVAIAVGDAVVLKPDSQTYISGGPMIADIFEEAGLPNGVLNVVAFDPAEVGDYLVEHPVPRIISFTGSTTVGRHIGELCGRHLKRASLELGGNNPFIVLEDANLEQAVDAAIFSKFFNSGQICVCTNRFFVHRKHYDEFIERFVERAKELPYGNPSDPKVVIGPLINEKQVQKVLDIVETAKQEGARLVLEGQRDGNVVTPFVFADVNQQSKLAQTEIFGPIATIIPFDTEEEVLEWANNTEYGLSGAIFTQNLENGVTLSRLIESGMTHINDSTVAFDVNAPFGGEKASGIGHYGGDYGFEEMTTTKWISVQSEPNRYPF
ncbi:aldehyde dehydrogenase family protein [Paenibacillus faecalis]|uniref:aldehyde dehydrogenase family protein n=1 Tax=Paenibacillus faecalis TaxID=2079532 RepID=UPI000D0FE93B|nr:aldehyde dehydrogenase family protein [Paenibacillus faecalis]